MSLIPTMWFYIVRQFALWFATVLSALAVFVFLLDLVEMLRRTAGQESTTFLDIVHMSFLKLPHLLHVTLPLAVLLSAMLAFWRLSRSNEIVAAGVAGLSRWHLLLPVLGVVLALGLFNFTAFNSVAAVSLAAFERIEARHFKRQLSMLTVSSDGIWLRQKHADAGQAVIHALKVAQDVQVLHNPVIFLFEQPDRFARRIDARMATLEDGYWDIRDASITAPGSPPETVDRHRLATDLTVGKITTNFASPATVSYWQLPGFIQQLEGAGFSSRRHELHWHYLNASPVLLLAITLLAAVFMLRSQPGRNTVHRAVGGILTVFALYMLLDILYAVGLATAVPVILAGWIPAIAILLGSIAALLHMEHA